MKAASQVPLGDIADFINGLAFKPSEWAETGARIIRIQNLTDPDKPYNRTMRKVQPNVLVQPGDLLVSWSATLGVFEWSGADVGVLNQHIFRVVPDDELVTKRYLKHLLVGAIADMERHLHGATMKHVNRREFLATTIPLPPLQDQQRIARVLDDVDQLRAKRRHSLGLLGRARASMLSATMSGAAPDDRVFLSDVLLAPLGNGISPSSSGVHPGEVLTLTALRKGGFDASQRKRCHFDRPPLARQLVKRGKFLVSRGNGNLGLVGRGAFVPEDLVGVAYPDTMIAAEIDAGAMTAEFFEAMWASWFVRGQIERSARTTNGTFKINQASLSAVELVLPTHSRQQSFSAQARVLRLLRQRGEMHLAHLDSLFASLQHRAFTGAL